MPRKGHFLLAEEGGMCSVRLVPRPAGSFAAQIGSPADLSNRAGLSTHRSPRNENAPRGGIFISGGEGGMYSACAKMEQELGHQYSVSRLLTILRKTGNLIAARGYTIPRVDIGSAYDVIFVDGFDD